MAEVRNAVGAERALSVAVTGLLLVAAGVGCGGVGGAPVGPEAAPATRASQAPADEGTSAAPNVPADAPSGTAAERAGELSLRAAKFVDAFWNEAPVFMPDGKTLAFRSNRDGLPQVYLADVAQPGGAARRWFTWPERVAAPMATHDGGLLFRSDQGADESWSFYRVGIEGSPIVSLTPGEPLNRDSAQTPHDAPTRLFYTARKPTEATSTLYEASTEAVVTPRAVYRDPKFTVLSDVSRDGSQALLLRVASASENYLLVVDTRSGQARTLYPASGRVAIRSAAFAPDGRRVLVATDEGGERQHVIALGLRTGKAVARYSDPGHAAINGLVVPKQGNTVALAVQAGAHSEIRLLDADALTLRATPKLPLGEGWPERFTDDGKRLAVAWSTASTPTDLYVVDVESAEVAPLRKEPRPTLAELPTLDASVQILDAFDGGKIPVNVFVPAGERDRPHAVIVEYHGGPSSVSTVGWSARRAFYLSLGYVVVEPNVRGSSGFGRAFEEADNGPKRLDAFKDVERAARWASAQPWADPKRMVVSGGSYGGYTVLVALTRWPDLWRAGIDLFGVANLETFMATTSGYIRELFLLEFGDPVADATFLRQISPLFAVDRIVAPTFVYAGANDPRVPRSESDLIVAALRARKVPSEYMVAENEGHSLARRENQIAFLARSARFLEQHAN